MDRRTLWWVGKQAANRSEIREQAETKAEGADFSQQQAMEVSASVSADETLPAALAEKESARMMMDDLQVDKDSAAVQPVTPVTTVDSPPLGSSTVDLPPPATDQPETPAFETTQFKFPYLYRFPGQDRQERILYVTREAKVMLQLRQVALVTVALLMMLVVWGIGGWLDSTSLNGNAISVFLWLATIVIVAGGVGIWAWLCFVWRRTIGIVTTFRLIKIIQVNPLTSLTQSLPLREVVDTSSDTRGLLRTILKLSTFTARSSATSSGVATDDGMQGKFRINKKYFYFENITNSVDLEHYINKLLYALRTHQPEEMKTFRPFVPDLKAGEREEFFKNYPQYWS